MSALISATVSLVVFVVCIGAYAATRPDVNAVARAYFAYGYARGQQDVLEGATIVGEVEQIDGMQAVADGIVAMYEREAVLACGGSVQ